MNPYLLSSIFSLLLIGCSAHKNTIKIQSPTFSPDGDNIIFAGSCNAGVTYSVIRVYMHDNKTIDKLPALDDRIVSNPKYFSDGQRLLYAAHHEGNSCADICIMDLADGSGQCITENGYGGWNPILSKDERKIYFRTPCEDGYKTQEERLDKTLPPENDIYSVELDGSNRSKLIELNDYKLYDLSLSNDGNQILMFRDNYRQKDSIWIYSLKSGSITPFRPAIAPFISNTPKGLAENKLYAHFYFPRFSPVENQIAFTWWGHGQGYYGHEIYLSDVDTKKTIKITNMRSSIMSFEFSPDGRIIVFVAENAGTDGDHPTIWSINVDGTELNKVLDGKDICRLSR